MILKVGTIKKGDKTMNAEKKQKLLVLATGLVIGIFAVILVMMGNPGNMGFCIACFIRDTAGALGMHRAAVVQYIRPEIIGLVLGSFIMSLCMKDYKPQGGSAPVTRFILGFFVMVGALMFLGCPLRMVLRLAGGDLNAIAGIVGFIVGVLIGVFFINKGFSLATAKMPEQGKLEGMMMPAINIMNLALLIAAPAFIFFSTEGPGAARAPLAIALIAGLVVGAMGNRSRICMVGGFRDLFLYKNAHLFVGTAGVFIAALIGMLVVGKFNLGFADQPVAHTDWLWNFLGLALVGFASALAGGCPIRQLVLSGTGSSDASVTVLGLFVGAAFCHNFGLASSAAGPTPAGQIAVIIGFIVVGAIAALNIRKLKN